MACTPAIPDKCLLSSPSFLPSFLPSLMHLCLLQAAAAVMLPYLSFEEACELANFGAKVVHPSTMGPAMDLRHGFSLSPHLQGWRASCLRVCSALKDTGHNSQHVQPHLQRHCDLQEGSDGGRLPPRRFGRERARPPLSQIHHAHIHQVSFPLSFTHTHAHSHTHTHTYTTEALR